MKRIHSGDLCRGALLLLAAFSVAACRSTAGGQAGGAGSALIQGSATGDCMLGGQSVPNGSSIVAYLNPTGITAQACASLSQTRRCFNGSLSGQFSYVSCTVVTPSPTPSASASPAPSPMPSASPSPSPSPSASPSPQAGGGTPDLTGTWSQACTNQSSGSKTVNITFSGSAAVFRGVAYLGSDCSASNIEANAETDTSFVIGAPTTTPADGRRIDFTVTHSYLTPISFVAATAMNSAAACGLTNWAANVRQEVTGKVCQGVPLPTGSAFYDIFKVVGGSSLYLGMLGPSGSPTDGSSDADRPTTYDPTPYTK